MLTPPLKRPLILTLLVKNPPYLTSASIQRTLGIRPFIVRAVPIWIREEGHLKNLKRLLKIRELNGRGKYMKTITLVTACALFFCMSYGQTKEKELSNAEKFSASVGTLIQITFLKTGRIGDVEIEAMHITNLLNNDKTAAVRFEKSSTSEYGSTAIAVLDPDEVDALLQSFDILKKMLPTKPVAYTEVNFNSRGGFKAGGFYEAPKNKWTLFLQLQRFNKDSYQFLDSSQFDGIINRLWDAKKELPF